MIRYLFFLPLFCLLNKLKNYFYLKCFVMNSQEKARSIVSEWIHCSWVRILIFLQDYFNTKRISKISKAKTATRKTGREEEDWKVSKKLWRKTRHLSILGGKQSNNLESRKVSLMFFRKQHISSFVLEPLNLPIIQGMLHLNTIKLRDG